MNDLKPFAVQWEARDRSGFNQGRRRVYAENERDAIVRAPRLIARDMLFPEGSVQVIEVTPIEARP